MHCVCPVGQPHVLLVLQTRFASPQCSFAVHATQVLSATLQCVFAPVTHVVSSMHATHVFVAGRHTGWVEVPPRPVSGVHCGLLRHSTQ